MTKFFSRLFPGRRIGKLTVEVEADTADAVQSIHDLRDALDDLTASAKRTNEALAELELPKRDAPSAFRPGD